jgi:hypothetical protein
MSNIQTNDPKKPLPQPPLRGDIREDDPRERAARRAREILEHVGSLDGNTDKFDIRPEDVPDGWVYNWKRWTVLNKEDPQYQISLTQQGWDYVPASRHPRWMPLESKDKYIFRDGMVLMERPEEIEDMAKKRDLQIARSQVRTKESQLTNPPKDGQFDRDNKGDPLVKVKKNWGPIAIPD